MGIVPLPEFISFGDQGSENPITRLRLVEPRIFLGLPLGFRFVGPVWLELGDDR